jgi:hypothetical protein
MEPDYFIGLDLGQASDYTALAVLERSVVALDQACPPEPAYSLRHLKRFALGTPYTAIVPSVARLAASPSLEGRCTLVVDQTGVGRPVVDMLRDAPVPARIVPVTITGGNAVTVTEDGSHHVPKKELVTRLQLLLQSRRLKVPRTLREVDILVKELKDFQVRITAAAHETFGTWREGQHDDLVLAVALSGWFAEREPCWGFKAFGFGEKSVIASAPEGVFLS